MRKGGNRGRESQGETTHIHPEEKEEWGNGDGEQANSNIVKKRKVRGRHGKGRENGEEEGKL